MDPHITAEGRTRAPLGPRAPGSLKGGAVICLRGTGKVPSETHGPEHIDSTEKICSKALQQQTFGTEESHSVVGAVSTGTLLLVEAPEAHGGVCVDLLPRFTGRDPFSGSCVDGPGAGTHPGTVVKADGFQLLVVSTATGVIDVEPRGPLQGVCVSQPPQRSEPAVKILKTRYRQSGTQQDQTLYGRASTVLQTDE